MKDKCEKKIESYITISNEEKEAPMWDKCEKKSQAMPRYSRHWDTTDGFRCQPSTRTLPTLAEIGMTFNYTKSTK